MINRHNSCAKLLAISLSLLPVSALVIPTYAQADELMKWERIPLQIPLKVDNERVVFVDKNVKVGFPPALNGKLRVQSTGGAVYLKASEEFPQTRIQLKDVETGEVILFDVSSAKTGPTEAVRLIYNGDVSTISESGKGKTSSVSSVKDEGTQSTKKKVHYNAPIPVLLTRYAAQSLYAPERTIEPVPGVHPVNPHLPKRITTLYPSEPIAVTPLAAWGVANRAVVALRLKNMASHKVVLDPRELQGQFTAATFQHRWLGVSGTPEDTTTVYLITGARPEASFISEPSSLKRVSHSVKGDSHAN